MHRGLPVGLAGLALAAAVLAACGRSEDATPASPPPPADAPAATTADFSRPLNALGTEPFWALKIRPDGLTFSTTGAKDAAARNGGPKVDGGRGTWTGLDAAGHALTATLVSAVCQDPMSGLSYPFTATVETGGKTLKGCAAYADAMPKG